MQKTSMLILDVFEEKQVFEHLRNIGEEVFNKSEYVKWRIKENSWNAIMYTSGKLVLQSSGSDVEGEIKSLLGKAEFMPHIGSDEVGKGDYFGPMVVCCAYVSNEILVKIQEYGIMDSKKLSDEKILKVGEALKDILDFEVKVISPRDYASLMKEFGNVAIVLAKAHAEVVKKLLDRVEGVVDFVVVDQFSKSKKRLENEFDINVPLKQYHRAESDIAVASASVLARYFFLLEFVEMNEKYKTKFPLGATHVLDFAKEFYKKYGLEELENVAKVSFRTTQSVIC